MLPDDIKTEKSFDTTHPSDERFRYPDSITRASAPTAASRIALIQNNSLPEIN